MNVLIAEKQNRRAAVTYKELMHLIKIAEYANKHNPDFDYFELFKDVREILNR